MSEHEPSGSDGRSGTAALDSMFHELEPTVREGSVSATDVTPSTRNLALTATAVRSKLEQIGIFPSLEDLWHPKNTDQKEGEDLTVFHTMLDELLRNTTVPVYKSEALAGYLLRQIAKDDVRSFGDLGFLLKHIGGGGFGRVDLVLFAKHYADAVYPIERGRVAAVKRLTKLQERAIFQREIELMKRVSDTGIVPRFYGSGELDVNGERQPWFAMEYLIGQDLQMLMKARPGEPFPPMMVAEILTILLQYIRILESRGVVHRDLKPSNVSLGPDGMLRLMDLGLGHDQDQTRHTQERQAGGTFAYAAPEMALGGMRDATTAADLYEAGAIAYHLLTGRCINHGRTITHIQRFHEQGSKVDWSHAPADCPPALRDMLQKLLAHDPVDRPSATDAFRAMLDAGITSFCPAGGVTQEHIDSLPGAFRLKVPRDLVFSDAITNANYSNADQAEFLAGITDSYHTYRSSPLRAPIAPARSRVNPVLMTVAGVGLAAGALVWGISSKRDAATQSGNREEDRSAAPIAPNLEVSSGPSTSLEQETVRKHAVRLTRETTGRVTLLLQGAEETFFAPEELMPLYAGDVVRGAAMVCDDAHVRKLLGIDESKTLPKVLTGVSARVGWALEHEGGRIFVLGNSAMLLETEGETAVYRDADVLSECPDFLKGAKLQAVRSGKFAEWKNDPLAKGLLEKLVPKDPGTLPVTRTGAIPPAWQLQSEKAWLSTVNGTVALWQKQIRSAQP